MRTLLLLALALTLSNCTKKDALSDDYLKELSQYRAEKMQSRKDGYLKLVALQKMTESINVFGKHKKNNLRLDIEALPDTLGVFEFIDGIINFRAAVEGVTTEKDSAILAIDLILDEAGNSQKLQYNQFEWMIITRGNAPYLRVWDAKNPEIDAFKGFEFFETIPEMTFEAQFEYFEAERNEIVQSKLGVDASTKFIGQLSFDHQGTAHTLEVGRNGFVMVSDPTNGNSTYGGGRYVYIDLPKENGSVTLDFNRLYNPPCSFNAFTTCLIPPRQNRLPFEVTAGETLMLVK